MRPPAGSMCLSPCQIWRDGNLVSALGTPGSWGIQQTTTQFMTNFMDYGMNIQAAIEAPRFRFGDPGKQIRMEITSRVKGRLQIRKVKAATEEALKKADPEAYKLYKKYTLNNALQIQIQGIPRGALPLPLPGVRPLRRPRPVLPLPRRSVWHQQVEAAQTSVDAAVARLQALAKLPSAKPEQLREVLGELSKAQKVLTALLGPRSLKPKPGGEKK